MSLELRDVPPRDAFRPMRVAILARTLAVGGTQRPIVELARGLQRQGHHVSVLVMYGGGALTPELEAAGIRVIELQKRGRWDVIGFCRRVVRSLRQLEPEAAIGFLPVQSVLLSLLQRPARVPRVVWSFRSSDHLRADPLLRTIVRIASVLSGTPHAIIVNSLAGARSLRRAGFDPDRLVLVPNGIDVERFRPAPDRERARSALGLPRHATVIGVVARLDPPKDHPTILRAAALLAARRPDVVWALVGEGPKPYAAQLRALASELGLDHRVQWLGERGDMPQVYPAFDLLALGSTREGFPNVVAEAMACGVPCVVTEAGDAPVIVGDTGRAVPVGRPDLLAEACDRLLSEDLEALGRAARQRVVERYNVASMVERTIQVLSAE